MAIARLRLREFDEPPPTVTAASAPVEPSERVMARARLLKFIQYTFPGYRVNWHHVILCDALERFALGTLKRLKISVPPQVGGKSEIASRKLPAFILGQNPDAKIITASHTAPLALKLSRAVQKTMLSRPYFELFPNTLLKSNSGKVKVDGYIQTAREFEVVDHEGSLMALGVGGGITGNPATHVICDDIIKGRKDADSQVMRDEAWDWLQDEVLSRVGATGGVCLIGTRWHEDDPQGRIDALQKPDPETGEIDPSVEEWETINLPARFEFDKDPNYAPHPKDPRQEGDPLWDWYYGGKDDKLSKAELHERARLFLQRWEKRNPRGFASLGQGRPKPREGVLFKWDWFQIVTAVPGVGEIVRYWDLAGTAKDVKKKNHDPDFSAGAAVQVLPDKRRCLLDMARNRLDVGARDVWILDVARADKKRYGHRIRWWIETEGGIGGVQRTKKLMREIQAAGISVYADPIPDKSKLLRADPLISAVKNGNLVLLEGKWNAAFQAEATVFTGNHDTHDDQIDAASGALSKLEDNSTDGFEALADD